MQSRLTARFFWLLLITLHLRFSRPSQASSHSAAATRSHGADDDACISGSGGYEYEVRGIPGRLRLGQASAWLVRSSGIRDQLVATQEHSGWTSPWKLELDWRQRGGDPPEPKAVAVMESAVRIQEVLDGVGQEEGVGVVILRVESGHARDVKDYVRIIASWARGLEMAQFGGRIARSQRRPQYEATSKEPSGECSPMHQEVQVVWKRRASLGQLDCLVAAAVSAAQVPGALPNSDMLVRTCTVANSSRSRGQRGLQNKVAQSGQKRLVVATAGRVAEVQVQVADGSEIERWLTKHVLEPGTWEHGAERVLCDTVGVDLEWRPSFSRGEYHRVAVVQLAAGDRVLVALLQPNQETFDDNPAVEPPECKLVANTSLLANGALPESAVNGGVPQLLVRVLAHPAIRKVGVGVGGDAARLRHDYALHLTPRVDLAEVAEKQRNKAGGNGTKLSSLAKITQSLLGLKLCKANRIRMTNWEKRPLSLEHEMYAALDAWVGSEALTVLEAALGEPVAVDATPVSTPRSRRDRSSRYQRRNQGVAGVAPVRT